MSDEPKQGSLARRVAKSLVYTGLGNAATKLISVVALLVTLKLVTREDFGVAMLVVATVTILRAFSELSLGVVVVQAKKPTEEQIDSLFTISLLVSGGITAAFAALAPVLAWFYDEPRLTTLLQVLLLALPLYALAFVPRAMMERELQFGRLAVIDNVALVASAMTMVSLAALGYPVWAFIWAEVVNKLAQTLGSQLAHPYRLRLRMHWATIRSMMGFGTYASGSRILYNLYINADYLIVGKVFSGEVLGIYTFAYKVISDPARALATIVNRVAYPAFARLQDDRARLERYFFAVARASLSLIGVLLVVVAVYIDETLILFDYQQWRPAVPLIRTFAVVGLMQAVAPIVPQMLNAVGRARNNFWYSVATAVVMPAAFLIGSRYGVSGVAAGWAIAYPLVVLVLFQYGARVFDMGLVRFTVRLLAGLLVVVPTACFALLAQWLLQRFWLGEGPAVLLGALATLLLGGGLAYLRERETLRRIRGG